MNKALLQLIAKLAEKSAALGCGFASQFGFGQPKESDEVRKINDEIKKG